MINEAHMSQEGDEEEEKKQQMVDDFDCKSSSSSVDNFYEWNKVYPPKSQRKYIELKDLNEGDFLELIEAKNQDKRFYGWLNF